MFDITADLKRIKLHRLSESSIGNPVSSIRSTCPGSKKI